MKFRITKTIHEYYQIQRYEQNMIFGSPTAGGTWQDFVFIGSVCYESCHQFLTKTSKLRTTLQFETLEETKEALAELISVIKLGNEYDQKRSVELDRLHKSTEIEI